MYCAAWPVEVGSAGGLAEACWAEALGVGGQWLPYSFEVRQLSGRLVAVVVLPLKQNRGDIIENSGNRGESLVSLRFACSVQRRVLRLQHVPDVKSREEMALARFEFVLMLGDAAVLLSVCSKRMTGGVTSGPDLLKRMVAWRVQSLIG